MPKPVKGDNGSGMHVHQSIWKGDTPMFMGDKYAGLSQQALYYIGGILKHARAINAFSNSTTNSYKRLIPGFEAPVILAYSARNRSASCRIPIIMNKKAARCEIRIPTVCGSLREAMENLDKDRTFLTQGGVFTDDQIDAYIDLKFQEIYKFEHAPHPIEFEMYYSQ